MVAIQLWMVAISIAAILVASVYLCLIAPIKYLYAFKEVDKFLIKEFSGRYVQVGAILACATEAIGIIGVRSQGAIVNVLSLIWVAIVPVAIIFHIAYRNEKIKNFCNDAATRFLVTIVMLLAAWYSHATASSMVTTLMGIDSSRFSSAVAATTFFGVIGLVSIVVAGLSVVFLLMGMTLMFFSSPQNSAGRNSFRAKIGKDLPRCLPMLFCAVAMVSITPEIILGGSKLTTALAARIAFSYDLSDPDICRMAGVNSRVLLLLDNPKRAIRFTADDLPTIPLSFMRLSQLKKILPVKQGEIDCK